MPVRWSLLIPPATVLWVALKLMAYSTAALPF